MRKFMLLVALLAFGGVAVAADEDGFIWVDANTKIRVKPIGKTGGSAAAGPTKAPAEPKKEKKPEKPKK